MIGFEWLKLRRSNRPWIALATTAFFLALMLVGFYTYAQRETGGAADFRYTYENESYFNGLTFALYAFYYGFLLVLPIFAATEGGVQIAGETASRTIHLGLARPWSRGAIFRAKCVVAFAHSAWLAVFLLALSLAAGLLLVGWGDLRLYPGVLQLTESQQFLPQREALVRFGYVAIASVLPLATTVAFALWLSTWTRSAVNAVGVAVALYLVMFVISEIHFFRDLQPYLYTHYVAYWRELLQERIDWSRVALDATRLFAFGAGFLWLAFRRFRLREDP